MTSETPLSALLEVLARSQRELENFELERAQSRQQADQAKSLIDGQIGGRTSRPPDLADPGIQFDGVPKCDVIPESSCHADKLYRGRSASG